MDAKAAAEALCDFDLIYELREAEFQDCNPEWIAALRAEWNRRRLARGEPPLSEFREPPLSEF